MTETTENLNIQWYPGHMTKARRAMEEDLKKVDLIIEILDARCPRSSKNPEIDKMAEGKYRLVVLNKSDLAAEDVTKEWVSYYKSRDLFAMMLDGRQKNAVKSILDASRTVCRDKIEKSRKKGILNVRIRAMVAGIPNVGKSTVINTLSGRGTLQTANRPGVTRSNQWIRLSENMDLLDTPGILWPKFEDPSVGLTLAFIGSVNDDILEKEAVARELLKKIPPEKIAGRYGTEAEEGGAGVLAAIAVQKNLMMKGAVLDVQKAAEIVLTDFRNGKFGRISLDRPE